MAVGLARQRNIFWLIVAGSVGLAAVYLPIPLFAGLLGAGILITAFLLEPVLALILTLCIAPLKTLVETEAGIALPLDVGQLGLFLFVGVWFLYQSIEQHKLIFAWKLLIPVGLFTLAAALSLWTAYSASHTLTELLKWVQILLLIALVPNVRRSDWLVLGLILSAMLQAVIGIWQFMGGSGAAHLWILDYRFFRAFGTFGQPNPFGGFMGMGLALAVGTAAGYFVSTFAQSPYRKFYMSQTFLYGSLAVLLLAGLLTSWSRGAWLGFMGALAVMIWAFPRQRWIGTLLVGGSGFLLILLWNTGLLPPSITARLTDFGEDFTGVGDVRGVVISDENFAVIERLAHWQSALEMAKTSPWLGIGFNNYEVAYPQFALVNWQFALGHAHNYYLNLLAETGIVGLSAYLLMWGGVFYHNWCLLAQLQHWQQRGMAVGLLGVWTHIAIHSLIDKLYVNNLFLHIGVMLGLLAVFSLRENKTYDGNSCEPA